MKTTTKKRHCNSYPPCKQIGYSFIHLKCIISSLQRPYFWQFNIILSFGQNQANNLWFILFYNSTRYVQQATFQKFRPQHTFISLEVDGWLSRDSQQKNHLRTLSSSGKPDHTKGKSGTVVPYFLSLNLLSASKKKSPFLSHSPLVLL